MEFFYSYVLPFFYYFYFLFFFFLIFFFFFFFFLFFFTFYFILFYLPNLLGIYFKLTKEKKNENKIIINYQFLAYININ